MAINKIRQYGVRSVPLLKDRISYGDIVNDVELGGSRVPASAESVKKVQQGLKTEIADRIQQGVNLVDGASTNGNTLGKLEKLAGTMANTNDAALKQEVVDRNAAIKTESDRAQNAEQVLSGSIAKETADRNTALTNATTALTTAIAAETKRASDAETGINNTLNILNGDENVDGSIASRLKVESDRAQSEESRIEKALADEIATRTAGVATKKYTDDAITVEKNRAMAAEAVNTKDINNEIVNRTSEVSRLDTKIDNLNTSATNAKKSSDDALQNEAQVRAEADNALSTRLNAVEGSIVAGVSWKGSVKDLAAIDAMNEADLLGGQAYYVTSEKDVYVVLDGVNGDYKPANFTKKSFLKIADFKELTGLVNSEKNRAVAAENTLANAINTEASNRANAISDLNDVVTNEKNRAMAAEKANADALTQMDNSNKVTVDSLRKEFTDADAAIRSNIEDEVKSINGTINNTKIALENSIKTESDRAKAGESSLNNKITVLNGDSTVAGSVASKVKAESDRAEAAEKANTEAIVKETADRVAAIKAESDRAVAAEKANTEAVAKEAADRDAAIKSQANKTDENIKDVNTKVDTLNGDKDVKGSVANAEYEAKLYADRWIPGMKLEGMDGKLKVSGDTVTVTYKPMLDGIIYGEVIVYDPNTGDAVSVNVASIADNVITLDTVTSGEFDGFACKVQYMYTKGDQLGDTQGQSNDSSNSDSDGSTI